VNSNVENALAQEIVSDNSAFRNLAQDWGELLERSQSACVFMRWEWHYTWWQVYADKRDRLHIVTWRERGRLLGVLPLYVRSGLLPGDACLRFLGAGESQIDEVATEYSDLLADRSAEQAIALLASHYLGSFKQWNRVEFSCVLDDALLRQSLMANDKLFSLERSAGQRYRIALLGDEAGYVASLPVSRAKRISRSRRVALRDGGISATPVYSIEDFDCAFKELAELNHERQAHKQRKSVFASERFRCFHHQLCMQLYDKGAVNIVRFHLNSQLLAVLYCFYDAQNCHYYQSGFARKGANRYMPLTLAHLIEMQRNREAGRNYYDLMRGKPPCYKDEFSCETTPMISLSLYRSAVRLECAKLYRAARSIMANLIKSGST